LSHELIFNEYGEVHSKNIRLQDTINQCGISRADLCYQRKKILDDFRKDVENELLTNFGNVNLQKNAIEIIFRQFFRRS
jgi:hypothetical protein